jgi:molybdopterin-guanine dinucleotide biosynthesis protein A
MGRDKTLIPVEGEPCAARVARALTTVTFPTLEVGPGRSTLPAVTEADPGRGPLAAIAAGVASLREQGHEGPALVLAGDLPLVSSTLLRWLADHPGPGSVVPLVGGWRQPLLARWSAWDLDEAVAAVDGGERSLRGRPGGPGTTLAGEADWSVAASPESFADIDTPEDLLRLVGSR